MYRFRKFIIGLIIFTIQSSIVSNAHARLIFANEIFVNDSESYEIGSDDDAAGTTLTLNFGGTNAESIQWDTTKFAISDDINVTGGVTASLVTTANGALTANGITTIGDGGETVVINSDDWDIDDTGIITGIGTIAMNGLLTGSAGATLSGAAINLNAGSNFVTNIGTGSTTAAVSIGGGSNTVEIATTSWDISTTGAATGLTGVTSTGILNFSGAGEFRIRENADPATNSACTTLDELIWDTTSNELQYCAGTGGAGGATWEIVGGTGQADQDFEGVYSTDAGKDLLVTDALAAAFTIGEDVNDYITIVTSDGSEAVQIDQTLNVNLALNANGITTIGDGGETVVINSDDWDIDDTGIITGIGTIAMNGLLTGSAGATLSGAAINLNAGSNFVTNIGTGSTTAAVSIGGGSNTVEIATTSWDISTTGAATGLTGVTSTGILNFSGAGEFRIRENSDPATNSACTTLDELIWDTTSNELQYCAGIGGAGAATWTAINGGAPDQDFEGVYSTDAGKDLLVTDALPAAFTIGEDVNDYITIVTSDGSEAVQIDQTLNINLALNANGITTIGDGGETVVINSSDWDIDDTGIMTGIGATTMNGLLTGSAGATLSGAAINFNVGSNFVTNIGTGGTTQAVTIGGGSNTVKITTTSWDISTTGAATGLTGVTTTGVADFSGTDRMALDQAAANPGTCTEGDIHYNTTDNVTYVCTVTDEFTALSAAGGSIPDFRSFPDTTSDAFVLANSTTDYWDEAAENGTAHPNITPSADTSEVLVMVTVGLTATGTGDVQGVMRVEREIGADPTCGSSTQIGNLMHVVESEADETSTSGIWGMDAPATTSNVTYTLCSDSTSTSTAFTIDQIYFTLYEVNNTADLAEVYATNDLGLEGGDLVELDPNLTAGVQKTSHAYNTSLLGVVSTKPSKVIGGRGGEGASGVPIALTGRAPVKVSTINGEIEKGDLLTASPIPGVAMKATDEGYMVGRALTEYSGEEIGSVLSFVETHYANPNTSEFGNSKTGVVLFDKKFNKEPMIQLTVNANGTNDAYYASRIVSKSKSGFSYKVLKVSNGNDPEDVTKSTIVNWTASEK